MGVYISESSLSFYSSVLQCGVMSNILILPVSNLLLLFIIYYYVLGKYFNKEVSGSVLLLKTEKDFSKCTLCIRIMCLVYIAVILSLNCIFVFLSTAVQEVPDTELKHCEDIFNLTGDTSHKFLHQVAMEQNLHCIDINITDGLLSVVLVIILSVSIITLLFLVLLKYTEDKDIIPSVFKLLFIAIDICFCSTVVPVVVCIHFLN